MAKQKDPRDGPSTSTGRKRKVFSEALGVDHLVQMSKKIAGDHADKLQQRVEKAKGKQAWEKERNRVKNGGKAKLDQDRPGDDSDRHSSPNRDTKKRPSPLSKSSHRASLIAKQREKSKMRKDARKVAKKETQRAKTVEKIQTPIATTGEIRSGRKKVSFA